MGAIQIGGQWFYVTPTGDRLGPFPSRDSAVLAGGETPGTVNVPGVGQVPANEANAYLGGGGGTATGAYDPNNPVVGSLVPGTNLAFVGYDVTGQVPQFRNAGRSTTTINGRLVDAETGEQIADFSGGSGGSLSQNTIYTQQQQNARDAATRAESQRQFGENFGANKAQFNIEQTEKQRAAGVNEAFNREQLDVRRGETLLNLGSRPDTLIRYLYALRGQQAPQGLGTPPSLPGFPGVSATPATNVAAPTTNVGTPGGAGPAAVPSAAPTIARPPVAEQGQFIQPGQTVTVPSGQTVAAQGTPRIGAETVTANPSNFFEQPGALPPGIRASLDAERARQGNPVPSLVNPANLSPTLQPVSQSVQFAPSGSALGNRVEDENDALNQIRSREQYNAYQRGIGGKAAPSLRYDPSVGRLYHEGGVIPERVMGMGMDSGQPYMFGEESHRGVREVVVPEDKVPRDIFERLMKDAQEVDYSETKDGKRQVKVKRGDHPQNVNAYAGGGPLGYQPIDPKVFNPPSISNQFQFPQIGNLTGGTSLIPSSQRLFEALPSERALFTGYLRDEVGAQPDDVFEMARRLAPQVSGLRAGRFVN